MAGDPRDGFETLYQYDEDDLYDSPAVVYPGCVYGNGIYVTLAAFYDDDYEATHFYSWTDAYAQPQQRGELPDSSGALRLVNGVWFFLSESSDDLWYSDDLDTWSQTTFSGSFNNMKLPTWDASSGLFWTIGTTGGTTSAAYAASGATPASFTVHTSYELPVDIDAEGSIQRRISGGGPGVNISFIGRDGGSVFAIYWVEWKDESPTTYSYADLIFASADAPDDEWSYTILRRNRAVYDPPDVMWVTDIDLLPEGVAPLEFFGFEVFTVQNDWLLHSGSDWFLRNQAQEAWTSTSLVDESWGPLPSGTYLLGGDGVWLRYSYDENGIFAYAGNRPGDMDAVDFDAPAPLDGAILNNGEDSWAAWLYEMETGWPEYWMEPSAGSGWGIALT